MIFVTVGAQMPFDRLTVAMDAWAAAHRDVPVFLQVGQSTLRPEHAPFAELLAPSEFEARYRSARLVVAHAGTGSILTALELGVPIVVMPRRASLRETRNEHQLATAKKFADLGRIPVAMDEHALGPLVDQVLADLDRSTSTMRVRRFAEGPIVERLRGFIGDIPR